MNMNDVEVTPTSLNRYIDFWPLLEIAQFGSEQQRDTLIDWAWSKLPAAQYEALVEAAGRAYLLDD